MQGPRMAGDGDALEVVDEEEEAGAGWSDIHEESTG